MAEIERQNNEKLMEQKISSELMFLDLTYKEVPDDQKQKIKDKLNELNGQNEFVKGDLYDELKSGIQDLKNDLESGNVFRLDKKPNYSDAHGDYYIELKTHEALSFSNLKEVEHYIDKLGTELEELLGSFYKKHNDKNYGNRVISILEAILSTMIKNKDVMAKDANFNIHDFTTKYVKIQDFYYSFAKQNNLDTSFIKKINNPDNKFFY